MIAVRVVDRPHRGLSPREVLELEAPPTVAHLHRDLFGEANVAWIIDGGAVPPERSLEGVDEITAIRLPEGPVIGLLVTVIVSTVISVGISFLIDLLFGTPVQDVAEDPGGSPTYGWTGVRNTRTQGNAIARIYGEHRVGGQIIGLYRRNASASSKTEKLFMLLALGAGPLSRIGQYTSDQAALTDDDLPDSLRLNGIAATTFDGIQCWLRMGRSRQDSLPADLKVAVQPYATEQRLSTDWITWSSHQAVTGWHLLLRFTRGLYDQSGGSGIENKTVSVDVQYLPDGGSTWTDVPGSPFSFTDADVNPFTRTVFATDIFSTANGPKAKVRIRLADASADDAFIADTVQLVTVNEITGETGGLYEGIALVGLEIDATEQLSGQVPLVTVGVRGLSVPVFAPGKDSSFDEPVLAHQYSPNPAWIALDILLDRVDGLGNFVTIDDIDMVSWYAWAQWCSEQVAYQEQDLLPEFTTDETEATDPYDASVVITGDDGEFAAGDYVEVEYEGTNQIVAKTDLGSGRFQLDLVNPVLNAYPAGWDLKRVTLGPTITQRRHEFHGIFDRETPAWEALQTVMRVGRAVPYAAGDRIKVRWEGAGQVVQHIADTNMVEGSYQIDYVGRAELADVVEIQFLDETQDYDQTIERARFGKADPARELVTKTINGYGITDPRQARREAYYQLRASQLVWKRCRFQLPIEGVAIEPGDVISIGSTLPAWSTLVTRANGTVASLQLDQAVVLESGVTYVAIVRSPEDPEGRQVTITASAGTYAAGDAISTDGPPLVVRDAAVSIGESSTARSTWRVTAMEITEDLTVGIEAALYVPEVYQLPGWTLGDVDTPPPSGCIDPGTYIHSLETLAATCECETDCGAGRVCVINLVGVSVDVTGDAASCVNVLQITPTSIVFEVLEGCEGDEFCLDIEYDVQYACCPDVCPDPETCLCELGDHCIVTDEVCFTVCA